jgi:hypothetical protein
MATKSTFETLCEKVVELKALMASTSDPETQRELCRKIMETMSIDELRMYREMMNKGKYLNRKKGSFHEEDSGKIAAFEYTPLNQEYTHQLMFLGNIHYVLDRLEDYECADKTPILEFIEHCYAAKADHIGSIYDLFYKDQRVKNPTHIPELTEPFLSKLRPSFETWNNALTYVRGNFESLRMATTALFGTRPTQETRIYFHGMFDNADDLDKYRLEKYSNIMDILYTVDVGVETVVDPYRSLRNNCVVYNPGDKEVELMLSNKSAASAMQENAMKNKIRNGGLAFAGDDDMAAINSYTKSIRQLDRCEQTDTVIEEKEELYKKIHSEMKSIGGDNEVIAKVTNLTTSKVSNVFVDKSELGLM